MPFKTVPEQVHVVVQSISSLEGMNIPNAHLEQACIVFVVDENDYWQLNLTSNAPIGPDVRPTTNAGTTRWLRLNIQPVASETPNPLKAWGNVSALGAKTTGEGFESEQTGTGVYDLTLDITPLDTPTVVVTPFNNAPLDKTWAHEFTAPNIVTVHIYELTFDGDISAVPVDGSFSVAIFYEAAP